ncbi:fungal-specific transcription factor domain-containing protein [Xylogone sp. PMI_703]|nr:fungal-specific transcription factor domain-containing protein [Xylogone sp. PMI_703]
MLQSPSATAAAATNMIEPRRPSVITNRIRDNKIKNACAECKRRKVRCDGSEPCSTCRWYKMPERCSYSAPEARPSLTRKSFDSLRSRLQNATGVLHKLFPSSSLDDLVPLSRESLMTLLSPSPVASAQSPLLTHNGSQHPNGVSPQSAYTRGGSKSPEAFEYDESVDDREGTEAIADDVNSLSLQPGRISSYVGPSSALAGLRVLLSIAPKSVFQNQNNMTRPDTSGQNSGSVNGNKQSHVSNPPPDPKLLIDAYFTHIHPKTPILDEQTFRQTLASGIRKDSPWIALLNIVYALGSIALTTSDSFADLPYYNTAKSHLGIESFGSGHIETVQALALMAGWYLHYRNRPNMASAVMGAVFRMANALGLHKELPGDISGGTDIAAKRHREIRRRIWWCLVVLDVGEATNLGRVSKNNLFDSEVNLPSNIDDETGELITGPSVLSNLIAEVEFSRQASHIQERLISSPQLSFTESLTLDAHLVYWYDNLPSYFHTPNPCPQYLLQPRLTAKWRYQNLRIILHRPVLMEAALRHINCGDLTQEQKVCVSKCQNLARNAIYSIASEWTRNQYSGWPASWYLFQACIIPLLSLYTFRDTCRQQVEEWSMQVQKALEVFMELEPWDNTAKRQHELISLLFNAHIESLKPSIGTVAMVEGSRASQMPGQLGLEYLQNEQSQTQPHPVPQQQNRFWNESTPWDYVFNYQDLYFDFPEIGNTGPAGWDLGLHNFDQS